MSTADLIRQAQTFNGIASDSYFIDQLSLGQLLADRASQMPDKVFLSYFDDDQGVTAKFTYREFDALVDRLAAWLAGALRIQRGDCVATLSHNHPFAAACLFACWRLGAVIAPQNVHEDDARIAFIVRDARCKVLLHLPDLADRARAIAAQAGTLEHVVVLADPGEAAPAIGLQANADLRAFPALLVYTSGTTGAPKGVLLTQYNILVNALGTQQWHRIDEHTRLMCILPIHHVNGIVVTLVTPLLAGASVVLNKGFKAGVFWTRLAEQGIAMVSLVPTILQFLCEAREDISRLDLAAFRYKIAKGLRILVINHQITVHTKTANFATMERSSLASNDHDMVLPLGTQSSFQGG